MLLFNSNFESVSITVKTARCRDKLRYVPKFTAASRGPPCDSTALVSSTCHFLTYNYSLQSADKDQKEIRAVAEKPHDTVVKFDTYRNLQRHRAVLPVTARHLVLFHYYTY